MNKFNPFCLKIIIHFETALCCKVVKMHSVINFASIVCDDEFGITYRICRLGISRATLYRRIREHEKSITCP